jgi:hypothetical protein
LEYAWRSGFEAGLAAQNVGAPYPEDHGTLENVTFGVSRIRGGSAYDPA